MKAVQGFVISFGDGLADYSRAAYNKVTVLFQAAREYAIALQPANIGSREVTYLATGAATLVTGLALLICSIVPPIFTSIVVVGMVSAEILLFESYRGFPPLPQQPGVAPGPVIAGAPHP